MTILAFLLIGLGAGIVGGFFGIGGGVVILPALIFLMGFTQKKAQGTSLVALIAPVGLLGLINYYKQNEVDLAAGAWIAAGFFGGGYVGSKVALNLNEDMLRKGFAIFLVLIALQLFFKK
jgi:uncharacterized membrane protein YfcA